ncbi:MAG: hypothetical protein M5R42_05515 [Rhodocyclaceae bacterium]|nr:hypothetical protein [Rhodocyclaceae bacterium]
MLLVIDGTATITCCGMAPAVPCINISISRLTSSLSIHHRQRP